MVMAGYRPDGITSVCLPRPSTSVPAPAPLSLLLSSKKNCSFLKTQLKVLSLC